MEEIRILPVTENQFNQLLDHIKDVREAQKRLVGDVNSEYLYTDEEFCQIVKCSKKTALNWRNRGEISFMQVGSFLRYRKSDILEFCERFKVKAKF